MQQWVGGCTTGSVFEGEEPEEAPGQARPDHIDAQQYGIGTLEHLNQLAFTLASFPYPGSKSLLLLA